MPSMKDPLTEEPTAEQRVQRRWANPDEDLLQEIRAQTYTGHNIPLTESSSTLGGGVPLIGDDGRTGLIKNLARRLLGERAGLRVLDLGALEGGLSFEMARRGWDVTGVEARPANFEKAELIRRYYGLPNLRFVLRDVKALTPEDGPFDVVLCCGLLYHLDDPFWFLRLVERLLAPSGLVFLDTHVAPDAESSAFGTFRERLSGPATFTSDSRTYEGQWFDEPRGGSLRDRMWSSVSNERSFWPTRKSLIRGLSHAGLHAIQEPYGVLEIDRELGLREEFSRLYLVALREW